MTSLIHDQAAGLRQLTAFRKQSSVRAITIAGGKKGVGKTSTVTNLALTLAQSGQRVLIIDENPCPNNVNANLGIAARYDLQHVINQDKSLDQVILHGPNNIAVLPAIRGLQALSKLNHSAQESLINSFTQLTDSIDVILVDTAMSNTSHVLPLSLASQQVLIVLSGSATSIKSAYMLIKIMSQEYAKHDFLVLVNKVQSEQNAKEIFDNISMVARQHLSVSLDYMGYVQHDEKLRRATQLCKPVVDAFPTTPAATNFRRLAENIQYSSCQNNFSGGIDNFMQRLIRTSHLGMANLTV